MADNGLLLQQNGTLDGGTPWPIVIAPDGTVIHGRPDAHALIGFEHAWDHGTVVVDAPDVIADPSLAIGLCPVFSAVDGSGLFSLGNTVRESSAYGTLPLALLIASLAS